MPAGVFKGIELESAIEKIESAILRADPSLKDGTFKIETRKIINNEGVKHEIDVFVSIFHRKGYDSVFIFEAKNWQEKISKNEIIIFQEKIKVTNAQKGFFVAREFTKDAVNQSRLEPRMELVVANDDFEVKPLFPDIHVLVREKAGEIKLTLIQNKNRPNSVEKSIPVDTDAKFVIEGKEKTLQEFADYILNIIVDEKLSKEPTQTYAVGEYPLTHTKTMDFDPPGMLNGQKFEQVEGEVNFVIKIFRPAVISKFDIASRGRVVSYEPVEFGSNNKFEISLIAH